MQARINGVRYNTETAQKLGEVEHGEYTTDLDYWTEALYRTRGGQYFVAGQGGPNSRRYGKPASDGSGWVGGRAIRPLGEEAAAEWLRDMI